MDILISINPEYVDKIVKGEKRYEFRKRRINIDGVDRFYIYSTAPVKKIVARMVVDRVIEGTPKEIWSACRRYSGVDEKDFYGYYAGSKVAYALSIKSVSPLRPPIDPYKKCRGFWPPQSYCYIRDGTLIKK
jgi:type I restriction enzyme S subunit